MQTIKQKEKNKQMQSAIFEFKNTLKCPSAACQDTLGCLRKGDYVLHIKESLYSHSTRQNGVNCILSYHQLTDRQTRLTVCSLHFLSEILPPHIFCLSVWCHRCENSSKPSSVFLEEKWKLHKTAAQRAWNTNWLWTSCVASTFLPLFPRKFHRITEQHRSKDGRINSHSDW